MSEWQPIATAPKDGTPILVYVPWPHSKAKMDVTLWEGNWIMTRFSNGMTTLFPVAPTHWMPLPEPPVSP